MTLVGIISDTHENTRLVVRGIEILKQRAPAIVVHCGDIVSPPTVERFVGLPMRFVFGNNDFERSGLKKMCRDLGFAEIDDTLAFTHAEKSFFVYHGTSLRSLNEAIDSQQYDYVLHGHTHEERDEVVGRTRVINPGALYSADRYTIAFLTPETGVVEFVEVAD